MFYQERRSIIYLISNIVVSLVYFMYVAQQYQALELTPNNDYRFWGGAILLFIPLHIVIRIAIHILFSIFNTIVTKEEEPEFEDEFDKLIELKSTRNFYHVFSLGFVLSLGALVLNMPSFVMFFIQMLAIIVAGIVGDVSQLIYYRRGV